MPTLFARAGTASSRAMARSGVLGGAAAGLLLATVVGAHAQAERNDADLFPQNEQYLRLGTSDRNITLSPFVQYDFGYSDDSRDFVDDGGNEDLRLARLYVFGTYGDLGGTFAYEFDNQAYPVRYAFVSYDVTDRLTVFGGQQDAPFSLQDLSGSRFLPFAEAGQSAALIPGDNVGVSARYGGERYSLAAGVFGGDVNTGVTDEGLAFTGRATWAPIYEESRITRAGDATSSGVGTKRVDNLLHLGAALSYRANIQESFSFAGSANSSLVSSSIATSPSFADTDALLRGNLEMSRQIGSFSVQGELTGVYVDGLVRNGTAHGGYLYSTVFLTGERRGYDPSSGTFGRVVPIDPIDDGGFGAIEIGARIDYLDLTDLGPDAGSQIGLSAVANAYLTKRITLTADYSYTHGTGGSADGVDVQAITGRVQFAY